MRRPHAVRGLVGLPVAHMKSKKISVSKKSG